MATYTREDLISLCEQGAAPEAGWHDRDSAEAQRQMGEAWALLRAGCAFEVLTKGDLKTDDRTIWVEITFDGFGAFEGGDKETELFYLPTQQRIDAAALSGGDWY